MSDSHDVGDVVEPLPDFSWLERRADGVVTLLAVILVVVDALLVWLSPGFLLGLAMLAGGLIVGVWLGLEFVSRLGRHCVGGMFLTWWLRLLFVVIFLGALGVGIGESILSGSSRAGKSSSPTTRP